MNNDNIENYINCIVSIFPDLINNINPKAAYHNAYSYYLNGHCYSFAKILQTLFPESTLYYNQNHVIVRIDEHFYDIRGCVDEEVLCQKFQYCPHDYENYLELIFSKNDPLEQALASQIIQNISLNHQSKQRKII